MRIGTGGARALLAPPVAAIAAAQAPPVENFYRARTAPSWSGIAEVKAIAEGAK